MAAEQSGAAWGDVGLGVASAISAWGTASANKTVARANRDAQEVVRKAQNQQRASALSLAATMRGIAYRAALGNAQTDVNNAGELIARTHESFVRASLETGLKGAEQMGAQAARAAAAGVGGSSVRMVSYTMQLQQARLAERQQERNEEVTYEMVKQRSGIMPAAASRLDVSPLNPNIDYSPSFAQPAGANPLLLLAQGVLSKRESLQVALDSLSSREPVVRDLPYHEPTRDDSSIFFD